MYKEATYSCGAESTRIDSFWGLSTPRLSAPYCYLLGKINALGTFFSMRHLVDQFGNHRCHIEKNVPIAFFAQ